MFSADTVPTPLSPQQLIDCTNGTTHAKGTEMFRLNSNCASGHTDLHLKWLLENQEPLQSAEQYPLRPDEKETGQCRRSYQPVYGADYYIHDINKRQVSESNFVFKCFCDSKNIYYQRKKGHIRGVKLV